MPEAVSLFQHFCFDTGNVFDSPSVTSLQRFITFCFFRTFKTEGVVNGYISKIISWWTDLGFFFDRKKHPILRRQLNGFKRFRPSKKLRRFPIIWELFVPIIKTLSNGSFNSLFQIALLSIRYFFGGRPCEYTSTPATRRLGDRLLTFADITFFPSFARAKEVTINFGKSKPDQFGQWNQTVTRHCICTKHNKICPVHNLTRYFKQTLCSFW